MLGMGYVILLWHSPSLPYNYLLETQALLQNFLNYCKLLTSCLTAVKFHVIRYNETVYEKSRKNVLVCKNSDEVN